MAHRTLAFIKSLFRMESKNTSEAGTTTEVVPKSPRDKGNLIFMALVVLGIGTMAAWNMFITAKDYFVKHKLESAPTYAQNFLAYVGWASHIPNLCFSWLNVFITIGGSLTKRILWTLCLEVMIFFITVILACVDSTGWPVAFFWVTMLSVFFLNAFNAVYQNCVYGVAAQLPPKYMGAVVLGCNICGTLVVLLSWMSKNFGGLRTAAIYYFIGGMFVMLVSFDLYFAMPLNKFYRYHSSRYEEASSAKRTGSKKVPYKEVAKKIALQLYNVFIVFFVSLCVFPAVISDIHPVKEGFLGDNFVLLTCFLSFNFMAMIGNITASTKQIPGSHLLTIFLTLRLLFIPFFLVCNYQVPGRKMPVLVKSDWLYWLMSILLGWTQGHGSSLALMYVSSEADPQYSSPAGMIGAAVMVTGILSGLVFTRLCPIIVSLDLWGGT